LTVSRQLLLDLGTPPPETFDNFVAGPNAELVARINALCRTLFATPPLDGGAAAYASAYAAASAPHMQVSSPTDRLFYIWGDPGSGRSHLLHALCHAAPERRARLLVPQSPLSSFIFDPEVTLYAIDDCDRLPPARQIAAFNLFNEVRADSHAAFVATGSAPPMALTIRDDLRTRLGWGLVYRLAPLADDEKIAALALAARDRGLALAADVPPYLLNHFRRDMPSLKRLLDALEQFSLERKRAITLPLLRTMLAERELADAANAAEVANATNTASGAQSDNRTRDAFRASPGADLLDTPESPRPDRPVRIK
jgi:DnaA family protein